MCISFDVFFFFREDVSIHACACFLRRLSIRLQCVRVARTRSKHRRAAFRAAAVRSRDGAGVTVDKPGALVSFAQALCSVLNSTGEALLSRGYSDMAEFIMHSAK